MFLFENVKCLTSHDKGKTYETILNVFESEGYTVQSKVLNAWDYGVAQKRERMIMVGICNDLASRTSFEYPEAHNYKPCITRCFDGLSIKSRNAILRAKEKNI